MELEVGKTRIVLVGCGLAAVNVLQGLAKQPAAVKDTLDVIVIDTKDYFENSVGIQRYLAHPERAKLATILYADMLKTLKIGTFIQGYVREVTKNKEVCLADGTNIPFDYCIIATGANYHSHPWINSATAALYDSSTAAEARAAAVKSGQAVDAISALSSLETITGMKGFDNFIVRDFLAHSEQTELLQLHALVSDAKESKKKQKKLKSKIETLIESSKKVKKFLKRAEVDLDSIDFDALCGQIEEKLKPEALFWVSRGLIKENVDDHRDRLHPDRLEQLALEAKSFEQAASILILGGGDVAVETAGDLAVRYPGKKITIMNRGAQLLERTKSGRAVRNINEFLQKHGVEVKNGESIKSWFHNGNQFIIQTATNQKLTFDKMFVAFGGSARSKLVKKNFGDSILNENNGNRISVDQFLRLTNQQEIFALGDVCDADSPTAINAMMQAELVVSNIVASNQGKKLTPYSKGPKASVVVLGFSSALVIMGDTCLFHAEWPMKMKDSREKDLMKSLGQSYGLDVDWTKEFKRLARARGNTPQANTLTGSEPK